MLCYVISQRTIHPLATKTFSRWAVFHQVDVKMFGNVSETFHLLAAPHKSSWIAQVIWLHL